MRASQPSRKGRCDVSVYNVSDDPITTLAKRLTGSQHLRNRAEVLPYGAPSMARQTAPNRIVLFATEGGGLAPARPAGGPLGAVALRDLDQTIKAPVWGATLPVAWDIAVRLVWALEEQAQGHDDGLFWRLDGFNWLVAEDTTQQGASVEVHFTVRLPIPPAPQSTGTITDTSITRE